MLKPDPNVVNAAIEADPVIKRLNEEVKAWRAAEDRRIAALNEKISAAWKEYGELKKQRTEYNRRMNLKQMVIRGMHRRTKLNKKPLGRIQSRINARIRVVNGWEEQKFLRSQREQFRKEMRG